MKIGERTPVMRMSETETFRMFPPSTVSMATPELRSPFHTWERPTTVQLRNTMFSRSPVVSVPSLRALWMVVR